MNSYLKQTHTKEVEKRGVSSDKLLLNFNVSAWNIDNIVHIIKKSPVTFMFKITQGAQALICISVVCFSVYLFYECLYIAF